MAGEDVRLKAAVKTVEDELNLIKNQVQQTLLDIREHILDVTNPFNNAGTLLAEDKPEEPGTAGLGGEGGPGGIGGQASDGGAESVQEDILPEDSGTGDDALADLPQDDVLAMEEDGAGGMDVVAGAPAIAMPAESFEAEDVSEGEEQGDDDASEKEAEADSEEDGGDAERESEPDDDGEEEAGDGDAASGEPAQDGAGEDSPISVPAKPQMADLDLVTLAALVRWVSVTTRTLGRHRVEVLLDAYELAGRISPQVKDVIKNLCELSDEDPDGQIPVRDVLSAMVRMEGVLTRDGNGAAHRLMALLLDDDDEPLTRLGLRG